MTMLACVNRNPLLATLVDRTGTVRIDDCVIDRPVRGPFTGSTSDTQEDDTEVKTVPRRRATGVAAKTGVDERAPRKIARWLGR